MEVDKTNLPDPLSAVMPTAKPSTLYGMNAKQRANREITDQNVDLTIQSLGLNGSAILQYPPEGVNKEPTVRPNTPSETPSQDPPSRDKALKSETPTELTGVPTKVGNNPLAPISPDLAKTAVSLDKMIQEGSLEPPTPTIKKEALDPTFGDYLQFFFAPLTAVGAFSLAPIAKNDYSGNVLQQTGQAFGAATQAFWDRIMPELDQTMDESSTYGQQIMEKYFDSSLPLEKQNLLGSFVDILGDPGLVLGTWATKLAQNGVMHLAKEGGQQIDTVFTELPTSSSDGVFYRGVQQFLGMGAVDSADPRITELGELARAADTGDRVAIERLDQMFSKDEQLREILGDVISPEDMDKLVKATDETMLVNSARTVEDQQQILQTARSNEAMKVLDEAQEGIHIFNGEVPKEILEASITGTSKSTRPVMVNLKYMNNEADVERLATSLEKQFIEDFQRTARRTKEGQGMPDWEFSQRAQNEILWDLLGLKTTEFAPEQAYAIRQSLAAVSELTRKAAQQVMTEMNSPGGLQPGTSIAWNKIYALSRAIYQKAAGVRAEAGRELRSYQMVAQGTRQRYEEIGDVLQRIVNADPNAIRDGGTALANEALIKILTEGKFERSDQLIRFLGKANGEGKTGFRKAWDTSLDALYEVYVNAILSGPITHGKNIASNAYQILRRPVETSLKGVNAAIRGDTMESMIRFQEARVELAGMIEQTHDLFRLSRTHGHNTGFDNHLDLMQAHEIASQIHRPTIEAGNLHLSPDTIMGRTVDAMGDFIRLPGSALLAEDVAFKSINYRMSINAAAARKAMEGTGSGVWGTDEQALFNYFRNNPDRTAVEDAVDTAARKTFTNRLDGEVSNKIYLAAKGIPGMRWFVPFVRTPINIIKAGIAHSPIGMFRDIYTVVKKGGPEADEAMANLAISSSFLTAAWSMLGTNEQGLPRITGNIDNQSALGKMMMNKKIPPYSVRVGDEWISYEGIEPLRTMLGMIVHSGEAIANIDLKWEDGLQDLEKVQASAIAAFFGVPFENFMLPQISQMHYLVEELLNADNANAGALKNHKSAIENQLKRFAQSMTVPQFVRQWSAIEARGQFFEASTYLDSVRAGIAGLGGDEYLPGVTPKQYDMFGDPRFGWAGGLGPDLMTPFPTTNIEGMDDVAQEVIRLDLPVPHPSRDATVPGVGAKLQLTAAQKSEFTRMAGKGTQEGFTLKDAMRQVMASPEYASMHDDYKRAELLALVSDFRRDAMLYLLENDPSLKAQSEEAVRLEIQRQTGETR